MKVLRRIIVTVFVLSATLLIACGAEVEPEADPLVIPATPIAEAVEEQVTEEENVAEPVSTPTSLPVPLPDVEPAASATLIPTSTPEPPAGSTDEMLYSVVNVVQGDTLNVRAEPGIDHEILTTLEPGQGDIRVVGAGEIVGSSVWVPIQSGTETVGWVNDYFLAESVSTDSFCADTATFDLVVAFVDAVEQQDSAAVAALVHPQRGLKVQMSWYNETVRFRGDDLDTLFTSDESHYWGYQDGSGDSIDGPFKDVVQPLLIKDLLEASVTGCNVIENGGSAGFIIIPTHFEGINYYSLYRPADTENGQNQFDWGTWAIGVEQWQGQLYISFLIHYQWEI